MPHQVPYKYYTYDSLLDKKVVDFILEEFNKPENFHDALVGSGNGQQNDGIRKTKISFLPRNHWINNMLWHYVVDANEANYKFDLTFVSPCQLTNYNVGDFYTWHSDEDVYNVMLPDSEYMRKLSFTIQLSDWDEYEGGQVQLMTDFKSPPIVMPRSLGSITFFDSRLMHRVLKVTKGNRKSLVGWVMGPRWK